ncbi:MAG: DNA-directed RNA polymerase subunit beta', partial [Methylophilaceae bacterium]|nr:DNA-directed RNA polymerase subunit beta' [Methylophilaceae bacterium]
GFVDLHAKVTVRINESEINFDNSKTSKVKRYETTCGRALLSEILPQGLSFDLLNKTLNKKEISRLINVGFRKIGIRDTVILSDNLKNKGFEFATKAGMSISVHDMLVPEEKVKLIEQADSEVQEIQGQYSSGLLTQGERYNKVVDIWSRTGDTIADAMMRKIKEEPVKDLSGKILKDDKGNQINQESFNAIYMMADSGARGSAAQVRQLAGMRGLMARPDGSIIETPIKTNFRDGLNVLQYFISTHGARKGLADTALKTANSGYLTRRLVDVTQDLVVTEHDCGTEDGLLTKALVKGGEIVEPLKDRILGRAAAVDILNPETQEVLFASGTLLSEGEVDQIEKLGIDEVKVRTALTCNTRYGICATCYGRDLGRGSLINQGEAVGVIAAQSIGEPGTQLTMRTFHIGGAAQRGAEQSKIEAPFDGKIRLDNTSLVTTEDGSEIVLSRSSEMIVLDDQGREKARYRLQYGSKLLKKDGSNVKSGEILVEWDPYTIPIITEKEGTAHYVDLVEG